MVLLPAHLPLVGHIGEKRGCTTAGTLLRVLLVRVLLDLSLSGQGARTVGAMPATLR